MIVRVPFVDGADKAADTADSLDAASEFTSPDIVFALTSSPCNKESEIVAAKVSLNSFLMARSCFVFVIIDTANLPPTKPHRGRFRTFMISIFIFLRAL